MSEPEVPTIPVDDSTNPVQQMAAEAAFEADNSESEDAVLDRIFGKDDSAPQQNFRTIDPEPQNDPDFDRAFKALQRDGVPAYIIDSIKSDPSKMKEWGLKAAKRQGLRSYSMFRAEIKAQNSRPSVRRMRTSMSTTAPSLLMPW